MAANDSGLIRRLTASVRVRATFGAVAVVAVALVAAAVALVLLQRETLIDGVENSAEARAVQVASQVESSGPPSSLADDDTEDRGDRGDRDEEPEDVVTQISLGGSVLVASQPGISLPDEDGTHELSGGEAPYFVAVEDARWEGEEYAVVVAVSLEDATESTQALVPLLLIGVPVLLLLVGGVVWMVVGRSLAPVERMRGEVESITDERLDRRVPVPPSHDEVRRLGITMNQMLGRLEAARDRQRRFISDASHELRSPIATLRQSGEVAQTYPDALEPGELADTVVAESLRLQRLVDQLILLTRADEGRATESVRDVDVDDLLLAEAARVRQLWPDVAVGSSAVTPGRVRGNQPALAQVLRNLADNALRHSRGQIRLGLVHQDGWVRVFVADDGDGVPEAERERVFERFVRLDDARARDDGGSGLGLAIVREIVTAHGGHVRVVPSTEGGALFVVDLPAR